MSAPYTPDFSQYGPDPWTWPLDYENSCKFLHLIRMAHEGIISHELAVERIVGLIRPNLDMRELIDRERARLLDESIVEVRNKKEPRE